MSDDKHSGEPGPGPADPTPLDDDTVAAEGMATRSAGGPGVPGSVPAGIPEAIGSYRILGKLGEGGMGVVFEAEQRRPRRKVAIKVVRGGAFVDEQAIRSLQREAETLARLKHPNIGGIYELGRTEDGQHFFAMELVRGKTLDTYLEKRSKSDSPRELKLRLGLFRKIADAVHYAHQRGVIHRDLKPSNIIVKDEAPGEDSGGSGIRLPEIKILDFGLARISEGDVAVATMTTEVGVIKGTLPYMSPEQARGNPEEIDVRTDVYALGVILYEMLAESRPYDVLRKSVPEALRVICEEAPKPLGQSWSGARRLDPDIGTIAGKALEKQADRRYASAAALSEDVARYLTSQPILARPPSTVYQLRKFAGRNRALVGGIAATFLVLVAGVITSTALGLREAAQRREAEQARSDLQAVVDFQAGMLGDVDPEQMGRRLTEDMRERVIDAARRRGASKGEVEVTLTSFDEAMRGVNATDVALQIVDQDILDRAGQTIGARFADRPLIDARLRSTIGATYYRLGLYEQAEPGMQAAMEIRKRGLGDDHPDTLYSIHALGALHWAKGELESAESFYREALEGRRRVLGEDHQDTLQSSSDLGILLHTRGELEAAEPFYRESLEGRRRVFGDDHPDTLSSIYAMGALLKARGELEGAELYHREALEGNRRVLGDDHPTTLISIDTIGGLLRARGELEAAEGFYREALAGNRRVLGDDHPNTLISINNVGALLRTRGELEAAEGFFREALAGNRRVLGEEHPWTLNSLVNLGDLHTRQGRLDDAEPLLIEAVEGAERTLPPGHYITGKAFNAHGRWLGARGRHADAEPVLLKAHGILAGTNASEANRTARILVELYEAWGKPAKIAEWRAKLPEQ